MGNRIAPPTLFGPLGPNWSLASLDTNSSNVQGAFQDSSLGYVNGIPTDTGSANNYQIALPFGSPTSLNSGFTCYFIPANFNTGASTLTVSPLGSGSILTPAGNALQGNEIIPNKRIGVTYNVGPPAGFYIITPCFLQKSLATGNVTVECAGYDSVAISNAMTSTSTITLNHIGLGVPISVTFFNNTGGASFFELAANSATGVSMLVTATTPGGSNQTISTPLSISNAFVYTFVGSSYAANQLQFIWGGK